MKRLHGKRACLVTRQRRASHATSGVSAAHTYHSVAAIVSV